MSLGGSGNLGRDMALLSHVRADPCDLWYDDSYGNDEKTEARGRGSTDQKMNEAGRYSHCSSSGTATFPARRTVSNTDVTSPNLTPKQVRLAVKINNDFFFYTAELLHSYGAIFQEKLKKKINNL